MRRIYFSCLIVFLLMLSVAPMQVGASSSPDQVYFSVQTIENQDGKLIDEVIINGPPQPPVGFARATVSVLPESTASIKTLTAPAYSWSFGCTATSAAMIAAYYDRNGYPNMYTGPTNGGVMPLDNSVWGTVVINGETRAQTPLSASRNGLDGRTSRGHVDDYWVRVNSTAPDPYITNGWTQHTFGDALGDYMRTNQSAFGNVDGSTHIYSWLDGAPFTAADVVANGISDDAGYGIQQFYQARGYTVTSMFNQRIKGQGTDPNLGFTFADFKAEIDAGRPVMIHVTGHTMVGVGYDDATSTIYLHDTWDYLTHTMTWGGVYAGMQHYAVTVVRLAATASPPGKATLVSPTGSIASSNPTYTWNVVSGASWYYLWVDGPAGNVLKKWYTPTDAGCGASTCSVASATPNLAAGAYSWKVQTWNDGGYGPWSDAMNFSVATIPPPGAATLVSPTGNITTNNPTYTWNVVSSATWYYLWVDGPAGNVLKKWYTPTDAGCGASTCSVANATPSLAAGAYSWKVQTWNDAGYGPWSDVMSFSPTPPGAATLVSPTGNIGTSTPAYSWNKVLNAPWYYLYVSKVNGDGSLTTVHTKWYDASQVCSGATCSVTPAGVTLSSGSYRWWVQTWNDGGYGPWSSVMNFSVPLPPAPGKATLVSPTGSIASNNPTYTWNGVSSATWYYLWVDGPAGNVLKKWYSPVDANCGASTCSVANATPSLAAGAYSWKVQTWNESGYGPWSDVTNFSPTPPGQATLVSPTGSIANNNPTYTWNKVSNATWYYVWVDGPAGNVLKKWYSPTDASCGASTCSVANATPSLAAGAHSWKVQTWNEAGYGPWSTDMNFSTPTPWPGQPTLISPNSSTNDLTPLYTWNAVTSNTGDPASWYQLWVDGPSGTFINQWYAAAQAGCSSGSGTCAITPTTTLIPGGTYTWWVRGYNTAGNGVWSNGMSFSHTSIGGFTSDFYWESSGWAWIPYDASWGLYNTSGTGLPPHLFAYAPFQYSKSAYYSTAYANFDVSARLMRDDLTGQGCVWCDNSLYVRGTPSPMDADGYWHSGYQFTYANDGYYSVWKVVNGQWTLLQDYTYTPAIVPYNNWNILRVVASDSNLYFYINGTLVWTGMDSSLKSGLVGVAVDNFAEHANADVIRVDWVTLSSYAEDMPVITDTVSPEQQALNDVANADGSDKVHSGHHQP